MYIKSIDLRNIYSFGNEGTPELKDFKTFNLFIGKNGSGKTNVFRALIDLNKDNIDNEVFNRNIQKSPDTQDRNLDIKTDKGSIVFKNAQLIKGNFETLKDTVQHIEVNEYQWSISATSIFQRQIEVQSKDLWLQKLCSLDDDKQLNILKFAFSVVFDRIIKFDKGAVYESFSRQPEQNDKSVAAGYHFSSGWSSGYSAVANLLIDFVSNRNKDIILIDEPEHHLEPRIIRNLLYFLFWLSLKRKVNLSKEEQDFVNNLEKQWNDLFPDDNISSYSLNRGSEEFSTSKQLFISSHSPVLINEFLKYSKFCSIYEFDSQYQDTNYLKNNKEIKQESLISVVEKIDKYSAHRILDNLGARGLDLLQTNGVIWVEGPSDVIYIRKWLEMYATEKNLPKFEQGKHYEFQMFGGTLLTGICYQKNDLSTKEELDKLVSMFSFSRNAFVIVDSDAVKEVVEKDGIITGETIKDKSKFKTAKEYIAKQFDKLSETKKGYKLGLWYKKGNIEIRTMESYIDDATKNKCGQPPKKGGKKNYAQKVVRHWGNTKRLSEIHPELQQEIENLYNVIKSWNT